MALSRSESEGEDYDVEPNDIGEESCTITASSHSYFQTNSIMKPRFDAMLRDIEQNLPTLEDNISDSEDGFDDEVEIFQRPANYGSNMLDDEDKDLDESLTSLSFGTTQMDLDQAEGPPVSGACTDNNSIFAEDGESLDCFKDVNDIEGVDQDSDGFPSSANDPFLLNFSADRLSYITNALSSIFPHGQDNQISNLSESQHYEELSVGDVSGVSRRDHLRNSIRSSSGVDLSLGVLENVDLDVALQNIVESEFRQSHQSRSSNVDLFDLQPGDNTVGSRRDPNRSTDIMNRLAAHSLKESGVKLDIDLISGAVRSAKADSRSSVHRSSVRSKYDLEQDAEKGEKDSAPDWSANTRKVSTGVSTLSSAAEGCRVLTPRPIRERFTKQGPTENRCTVFLDLRKTDEAVEEEKNKLAVIHRVLKLHSKGESSESSSESSADETSEDWFSQRRRIRQAIEKGRTPPPPLEKIKYRTPRRITKQPKVQQNSSEQISSVPESHKDGRVPNNNLREDSSELTSSNSTEQDITAEMGNLYEAVEEQKRRTENEAAATLALEMKAEAERLVQAKHAVKNGLETLKPTVAADLKRKAASEIPVLFHMESSYEKSMANLPDNISHLEDVTLITVNLSSNGELLSHRAAVSSKAFDKGDSWSVSYLALVTWLCSLIPEEFEQTTSQQSHNYPFSVIGLQQMFFNGVLTLAIAVTSLGHTEHRLTVKKGIKKSTGQTPFHQMLTKFLSTNTLRTVNPWLDACIAQPIHSMDDEKSFFYIPPALELSNKPLANFMQVHSNTESVRRYFGASISFFWQTLVSEESTYLTDDELIKLGGGSDIQNTLTLIYKRIYREPRALFAVLSRLLQNGLDIAGLRLATPVLNKPNGDTLTGGKAYHLGPILSIAIRGTLARPIWLEELGPMDPVLARQTDPNSLTALYGGESRDTLTLFTPRNPIQVSEELCRWFGARVADDFSLREQRVQAVPSNSDDTDSGSDDCLTSLSRIPPVSLLVATAPADVVLVVSPLLPVKCIGIILATCQRRGYQMIGIRRRRLSAKQVASLGISTPYSNYFTYEHSANPTSPRSRPASLLGVPVLAQSSFSTPRPVILVHLSKENAYHHSASLIENFMVQLTLKGLLDECNESVDGRLSSSYLFHVSLFNEGLLAMLGGDFTKVPQFDSPAHTGYIAPKLHVNSELEQITVLTLVGTEQMGLYFLMLGRLLNTLPHSQTKQDQQHVDPLGLELLGIKWLSKLNSSQAKELTPHEVGHPLWKSSVKELTSEPALITVFRGLDCKDRIQKVITSSKPQSSINRLAYNRMVSPTPEIAYRLCTLFFYDRELFADNDCRYLLDYLPPVRSEVKSETDTWDDNDGGSRAKRQRCGKGLKTPPKTPPNTPPYLANYQDESIFKTLLMGPRPLVTVLVIKPSVVKKNNLAKLLRGLALERFQIVGMLLAKLTELDASILQSATIRENDQLFREDIDHMTSSASLVLALSRENAVKKLLDILGPEDSQIAKRTSPFLWRAMYGSTLAINGFYGSTSYACAVRDVKKFFPDGLCCQPTVDLTADNIMCPAIDTRLANGRVRGVREQLNMDTGPYNLVRLMEVNCVVVHSPLLKPEPGSKQSKLADLIQCFQEMQLQIVGARLLWMSEEQAQEYLHVINAGSFHQVPYLTSAPLLVLAIQGDHSVISFNYLFDLGMLKMNRTKEDYLKYIYVEKDIKKASALLAYFFDQLMDECKITIIDEKRDT